VLQSVTVRRDNSWANGIMYLETWRLIAGKLCVLICGKRAEVNTKV